MRIVAGRYRGKKLKEFELNSTRPTLDKVKEAMFDIVQFKVAGARVLDLFAGTGALGIEALSRGAESAVFVDNNPEAIKIINANLKGIEANSRVENADFMQYLKTNKTHFDLILLDAPFNSGLTEQALEFILKQNVLSSFGTILVEFPYNKPLELSFLPIDIQTQIKEIGLKNKVEFKISGHVYSINKRKYGTVAVYVVEQVA